MTPEQKRQLVRMPVASVFVRRQRDLVDQVRPRHIGAKTRGHTRCTASRTMEVVVMFRRELDTQTNAFCSQPYIANADLRGAKVGQQRGGDEHGL